MASVVPEADLWGCSLRVSLAPIAVAPLRVQADRCQADRGAGAAPQPRLCAAAARALLPHIKMSLTTKHAWSTLGARLHQRSRKEQGYGFLSFRDGDPRCHVRRLEYHAPRYSC